MNSHWMGFFELIVVFGFVLGWGVLELVALRYDRKREKERSTSAESGDTPA